MENEGTQEYTRILVDGSANLIEEVGVSENTFSITQIVLTITGGNGDAVVTHANNPFATPSSAGNGEFTFGDTGSGVTIAAAETFIKSLRFGINNDEPTGFPGE